MEKAFDDVALSSSIMQCPLWVSIRISAISKNSDASYQLHWPGYSRGKWFAKILWSFSLAREVGQKAKTSSSLFAKETFPLAVYFPSSPTRNVERYPGCIDILPTLKMSWEVHRRWCSSAVWWRGHHVPEVGFKFRQRHPSASLLFVPGWEGPWRPGHFWYDPCLPRWSPKPYRRDQEGNESLRYSCQKLCWNCLNLIFQRLRR